ncbi:DUF2249 domain-containing protein [Actinomadura madurae]|uniref:Uncharacterized conserved protein, DUF2249 family n=1 Tax=Actinomadura madurae TaxID=1993 RepID=A0A1I5NSI6_9ACTN|nr:DUF2249 domain-containing protein [Actinomadura madurae]SFP24808.1 Uncharacterized conserved protein, DUF2249 family [Actinomadura madurae]SPT50096.1 Uncharacterized conserved protein (DUF2249) [Actinomadura madurae]
MTTSTASPQQETVRAILDHHERLGRTMADHALTVSRAVDQLAAPYERRDQLVAFCLEEVLPHAEAEEGTLYEAAEDLPGARLLLRSMLREHTVLRERVAELGAARTPGEAVSVAAAVNALFQSHLEKENDLLLPALVDAGVDLGALLAGMHEILGGGQEPAGGHHCTCGGHDDPGTPGATAEVTEDGELDVRTLVPAQRHQQIFAAFGALAPGTAFVLVNDHDPKPLYYQFAAEHPGGFTWDYEESGPEVWRVRVGRP